LIIPSKNKGAKDFLSNVSEMRKPNKVFGGDGSSSDDNLEEDEEDGAKALDWRSRAVAVGFKTIPLIKAILMIFVLTESCREEHAAKPSKTSSTESTSRRPNSVPVR
jgi:hypothetical protein